MEIEEEKSGALCIVALIGRMDGLVAPEVEQRLASMVDRGDKHVLLDCARMSYISSAGLRAVLGSARKCQQAGGKLSLCALQPACKTVMEISGFLTMIPSYETRDAAVSAES